MRQSDDGAAVVFDVLHQQRFVEEAGGAPVRARAGRRRRRARRAGLGRARAGLAYLSAERRHPEPHPRAGRRDRRAKGRERLARVGAPKRRRTTIAVDGARARFTVRW